MLDINSLLVISLGNISSYSVACLFVSLMVCFAVRRFLSLIRSHLFIFVLIFIRGGSKKDLLHFMSKCVLLFFSRISLYPTFSLGL